MKRLIKATFFSLKREGLSLDNDEAINFLSQKDSRLRKDNVILYNGEAAYGGIYYETNSTAKGDEIFAVEIYSFESYDKDTNKYMSYAGAIATKIDYLDENGDKQKPKLNKNYQYGAVYNAIGSGKYTSIVMGMMNNVTIEGLSLKYISKTFEEAAKVLNL